MEKNSAIWAQPLILRFRENLVCVEDENGDLVEHFPIDLIEQPTAHVSNDSRDPYNNLLLFIVREDTKSKRTNTPTEMHIFQCNRVAATDVADDLQAYCRGQYRKVQNGRRSSNTYAPPVMPAMPQYPPDDASIGSDSSEIFERDVNTLNRCFDDIERFVARIQSAALAQREIEAYIQRSRPKRDRRPPEIPGILQMRAQLPLEQEFVDILRKFKLSFNLLAKLKNHIHEPNAPELLHFLFTPLNVILETCHWGLGKNIAPWVVSPLLSLEARELLQNCLTSKESDIWMSLGEAWRTPPEDWVGALPSPYRPVFLDGFAPYGTPDSARMPNSLHRGQSAPPEQFRNRGPGSGIGAETLELDRLSLEKDRLEFEKSKIAERERRILEEKRQMEEEKKRLDAEKAMIRREKEEHTRQNYAAPPSQASPPISNISMGPMSMAPARVIHVDQDITPRQKAFIDDVTARGAMLVTATFDRVAQNQKELTVNRGEYLEVLDNSKNWWQCRNMLQRVGYVPHTILSVVPQEDAYAHVMPNGGSRQPSSQQGMLPDDAPAYVKERQGKRGEFRYF
ncbi:hypothetical protein WR25_18231 isoform A [Diploscapter pachys]|uniref:SH3 domain-containing protein n=1 Tax=Diploscapter pachys TaxID=2018661 RepID=A0A2A2LEC9_9BILA|nr:hypothetical protein WR25_18231 isoform A [Diploscapter pachys]